MLKSAPSKAISLFHQEDSEVAQIIPSDARFDCVVKLLKKCVGITAAKILCWIEAEDPRTRQSFAIRNCSRSRTRTVNPICARA
jgi:hypothetical protein